MDDQYNERCNICGFHILVVQNSQIDNQAFKTKT